METGPRYKLRERLNIPSHLDIKEGIAAYLKDRNVEEGTKVTLTLRKSTNHKEYCNVYDKAGTLTGVFDGCEFNINIGYVILFRTENEECWVISLIDVDSMSRIE